MVVAQEFNRPSDCTTGRWKASDAYGARCGALRPSRFDPESRQRIMAMKLNSAMVERTLDQIEESQVFRVTAQVGDLVQDRRRDFAKDVGSQVRASMMAQPCFLAVEKNERMSAKSTAPSTERKPPEIFWRNFIMRPSRSA